MARWRIVRSIGASACALVLCLLQAASAQAQVPIEIAVLDTVSEETVVPAMLAGDYDAQFRALPDAHVLLRGAAGQTHWLRLTLDLPPAGSPSGSRVLVLDRIDLDSIALHLPGDPNAYDPPADGFFFPQRDSLSPDSYAFELPAALQGPQTMYVSIRGLNRMNLTPRVIDDAPSAATTAPWPACSPPTTR